jgi:hypothetical protein
MHHHRLTHPLRLPLNTGLSEVTAPMALAAGARGVGVGQAVTKCPSEAEMAQRIKTIARAMGIAKVEA